VQHEESKAESNWAVYIALCADDTLYTGIATNAEARIAQHNNGAGARYTRTRLPVRLVYVEVVATRSDALRREFAIKRLPRAAKRQLIGRSGVATGVTMANSTDGGRSKSRTSV
jgi:putative endonuclease